MKTELNIVKHTLENYIRTAELMMNEKEFSKLMFEERKVEWGKFYFVNFREIIKSNLFTFVRSEEFDMVDTKWDWRTHTNSEIAFKAKRYWYKVNVEELNRLKKTVAFINNLLDEGSLK